MTALDDIMSCPECICAPSRTTPTGWCRIALDTGVQHPLSVVNAAVIKNFYSVTLPDSSVSDAWERWLSQVESEAAPDLRRARNVESFQVDEEDRLSLARWIAIQYLRGPDSRRMMREREAIALRMQVGMGGLAYLHHATCQGLAREVPIAEVERVWNDLHSAEGPAVVLDSSEHLATLARLRARAVETVLNRTWCWIQFTRKALATSDVPVCLIPGEGYQDRGLLGAWAIIVALDRRTLLWLD